MRLRDCEPSQTTIELEHCLDKARLDHEAYSPEWFASYQLEQLRILAEKGLPAHYKTPQVYMNQFWASFPWDQPARDDAIKALLDYADLAAIRQELLKEWNTDIERLLLNALGRPLFR